jgi:hypothetical protein
MSVTGGAHFVAGSLLLLTSRALLSPMLLLAFLSLLAFCFRLYHWCCWCSA